MALRAMVQSGTTTALTVLPAARRKLAAGDERRHVLHGEVDAQVGLSEP